MAESMTEAETVAQLIGFTSLLLGGVSVFFTVVSAYVAGLNYFVRRASLFARIGAFSFFTAILGMLMLIMIGARRAQLGLVEHLTDLSKLPGGISKAGKRLLENGMSDPDLAIVGQLPIERIWRENLTLDGLVVVSVWGAIALTFVALFLMTFVFRWENAEEKA